MEERKNSRSLNTFKDWALSIIGFVARIVMGLVLWGVGVACCRESFSIDVMPEGAGFAGILLLLGLLGFLAGIILIFPMLSAYIYAQINFCRNIDEIQKSAANCVYVYVRDHDLIYKIWEEIKTKSKTSKIV